MTDLEKAKGLLASHTCVLCKSDAVYASLKTGIAPMLDWIADGAKLHGFSAADKIVGKAAALLFVYTGIREVYGEVISEAGLAVLKRHHIPCSYGICVPFIINRRGDGMCPMEETVQSIDDPGEALQALTKKRNELQKR